MTRRWLAVALVVGLVLPGVVLASVVVPAGTEFQVNAYTTNDQDSAAICSDPEGNFVVVWESFDQDGSYNEIFGQRYASNGYRLGTEFQVNTYTSESQNDPSICCDEEGNFVVVWESYTQDGSNFGVFGQRFFSDGSFRGTEFQVNTYTSQSEMDAAICCTGTGEFVVSWESYAQDGDEYGVFAQRFRSNGTFRGTEFQVNTVTSSEQDNPAICCDAYGNFNIVWESTRQDGNFEGVFGQRFFDGGAPRGTEFQVNTYTSADQDYPAICCDATGNFVVAWEGDEKGSSDDEDVFAQRFSSTGDPRGTEFMVNSYTTDSQGYPTLCCGKTDGTFTIAWDSGASDEQGEEIRGRRFGANGFPDTPEFQITAYTSSEYPAIACDDKGNFVVVWQSDFGQDGNFNGVFGKRFLLAQILPTPVMSWIGLASAVAGLLGLGGFALRRKK